MRATERVRESTRARACGCGAGERTSDDCESWGREIGRRGGEPGAPRLRSWTLSLSAWLGLARFSGEKIRDLAQARRATAGWLAGLAWRTESSPGHPPRPFTGTEPHPMSVALMAPYRDLAAF